MGFSFKRLTIFFTFRVLGVLSGCLVGSGGLRSPGPPGRARADAGSVGTFLGNPSLSRSGLDGAGLCAAGFDGGSRDTGAALNLDDISGLGAVTVGLDAFFMLKLNLLGVCDWGPVGGGRLGGGGILSSLDCSALLVSSTCRSFDGLNGFSPSSFPTSAGSGAGSAWLLGDLGAAA